MMGTEADAVGKPRRGGRMAHRRSGGVYVGEVICVCTHNVAIVVEDVRKAHRRGEGLLCERGRGAPPRHLA